MDVPLLTDCLTAVREYYGVEIRQSAADVMEKRLKEFDNRTFQVIKHKLAFSNFDGILHAISWLLSEIHIYIFRDFIKPLKDHLEPLCLISDICEWYT